MADKNKKSEMKAPIVNTEDSSESADLSISEESVLEDSSISELQEQIAQLLVEKADLQDNYLRKHADFENYRKRMAKEKLESIQYANADLIEKMLDVLDNFDRAQKAAIENPDLTTITQGITMIEQNLLSLLESKGLSKLTSMDQPFNPEHHLAISMEENSDVSEAKVIEEFQAGYLLHDRLLRTAKVRVAMPKANQ